MIGAAVVLFLAEFPFTASDRLHVRSKAHSLYGFCDTDSRCSSIGSRQHATESCFTMLTTNMVTVYIDIKLSFITHVDDSRGEKRSFASVSVCVCVSAA